MSERIITISREFGSGGRTVGRMAAKALNIPCYDQEILEELARKSGFTQGYIQEQGEYAAHAGWLSNALASRFSDGLTSQDRLWVLQRELILELAEKGPCVIVGRCADEIMRQAGIDSLNVFIHADQLHRAVYASELTGITSATELQKLLKRMDTGRQNYYTHYTGRKWGDLHNYHLSLDSGTLGYDLCAKFIVEAFQAEN